MNSTPCPAPGASSAMCIEVAVMSASNRRPGTRVDTARGCLGDITRDTRQVCRKALAAAGAIDSIATMNLKRAGAALPEPRGAREFS